MTSQPQPPTPHAASSIHIKTPCPKTWDELSGDDAKRYCSECSLHVLNSVRLTRTQAHRLVATASERVCMRIELDASGAPVFLDSPRPAPVPVPVPIRRPRAWAVRAASWIFGAAAGLLAACQRSETLGRAASSPPPPAADQSAAKLGEVATTALLGDVACPPVAPPEVIGEVSAPPPPEPPQK
jgi:hypothetical protein